MDVTLTAILNEAADFTEEVIDGRNHLVVNGVAIAEGVVSGSAGPIFYSADELRASDPLWDHKPIVVNHPKDNKGRPLSAAHPVILNNSRIGFQLNTKTGEDGKQRFKAYIDEEKANKVDRRIVANVRAGKKIEVSTGLGAMLTEEEGTWNGTPYKFKATGYKPDHLAVLPDEVGAYSVAAGGGLLANSSGFQKLPEDVQKSLTAACEAHLVQVGLVANDGSMEATKMALYRALAAAYGEPGKSWDGYIEATFPDQVVYCCMEDGDRCCNVVGYKTTKDGVELVGDPTPVQSVYGYRTPDGTVLMANSSGELITQPVQEKDMTIPQHIAALIANGQFAEADRPALEAMKDTVLKIAVTPKTPAPTTPVQNAAPAAAPVGNVLEQLKSANPDVAYLINAGLADVAAKRTMLVNQITAVPGNKFNPEYLKTLPIEQLDGMAALIGGGQSQQTQVQNNGTPPMFLLQNAGVGSSKTAAAPEEPLVAPDPDAKA